MSDSPEKQAAIAHLLELEQDLAPALLRLKNWNERDRQRDGGSIRQDNIHEEAGRDYQYAVDHLRNLVEAQKRLIDGMD